VDTPSLQVRHCEAALAAEAISKLFFASARGIVRGLNFFAVCYGLRFANLQEFLPPPDLLFANLNGGVSQFLHSLNVNPCTPIRDSQYAEKILMAAHNTPRTVKV